MMIANGVELSMLAVVSFYPILVNDRFLGIKRRCTINFMYYGEHKYIYYSIQWIALLSLIQLPLNIEIDSY